MGGLTTRKGQSLIFGGMVACAAVVLLQHYHLDFLSGISLGVSLGLFFLGFREFYQQR